MAEVDEAIRQNVTDDPTGTEIPEFAEGNPAPGPEPDEVRIAGNWRDDDGPAYEEFFEPNAEGLAPADTALADAIPETQQYGALGPVTTRVLVSTFLLPETAAKPWLLFDPDPNREDLILRVYNAADPTVADPFRFGSDPATLYQPIEMLTTDGEFRIPKHTGAVYVYAPSATGPLRVCGWAVTK
jgi:hypothetical protein